MTWRNLVAGALRDATDRIEVTDPATGAVFTSVPAASPADIADALVAAAAARNAWRRLPSTERAAALRRIADGIAARAGEIGAALARESGKSLEDATAEAIYGVELMRYHAEWARRIEGEVIPSDSPDETLLLKREPIGVVACLIPFNFPVYTLVRKVAPALITGNTVIVRPSNTTPTSALVIADIIAKAGLPAGVVNILAMSHEAAAVACTHPAVGMITLTGSLAAGRAVLDYCKVNIARPSLELGGKTPVVIAPDADPIAIADLLVAAKTRHCGQICTSPERVYVARPLHAALIARMTEGFAARAFGNRATDPSAMGPLASRRAQLATHEMVVRAIAEGGTLKAGGYVPDGPGFFYPATLIDNCRQEMEIIAEEIFGPVLPVVPVDSPDEALRLANDHQYGLASVVFTNDHRLAMRFADAIEAGELYLNRFPADPYQGFHAGWKRSGLGGDDGKHGMLEFTQTRLVVIPHQE